MKKFIISLIVVLFAAFSVKANEENTVVFIGTELAAMDGDEGELYEVINAASLNVRSGPSTNNKVIGKLEKGDIISVISFVGNWARFTLDGKTAYVSKAYLQKVEEQPTVKEVVEVQAPVSNDVEVQQPEQPVVDARIYKDDDEKSGGFGAISALYMVGNKVHQVGMSMGWYTPFRVGFDYRMRIAWKPCFGMMWDFMPNYNVKLALNKEAHTALFFSPAIGPSIGFSEYKDKSKFAYGLMLSPKLVFRANKITLSLGYNMGMNEFRFKKYALSHQFLLTFGVAMGTE